MRCMPNPALIMDHYEDREIRTLSEQWIRDDRRVIFLSQSGSLGCQNSTNTHYDYLTRIAISTYPGVSMGLAK